MQNKHTEHLTFKKPWQPRLARSFVGLFFLLGLFFILSLLGQKAPSQSTEHQAHAMPCCQQMAEADCPCCHGSLTDHHCSITCSASCAMVHAASPFMPVLLDASVLYAPALVLRLIALTSLYLPNPELDNPFRPPRL